MNATGRRSFAVLNGICARGIRLHGEAPHAHSPDQGNHDSCHSGVTGVFVADLGPAEVSWHVRNGIRAHEAALVIYILSPKYLDARQC